MNNAIELMFFRQMLGGDSWVQAVFLAGVFAVLLYRRDKIVAPYMFRVAIILFVLSFIVPVVFTAILQYAAAGRRGGGVVGFSDDGALMHVISTATGPVLLGLAVLLCVLSMLPAHSRYPSPPVRQDEPHPLD